MTAQIVNGLALPTTDFSASGMDLEDICTISRAEELHEGQNPKTKKGPANTDITGHVFERWELTKASKDGRKTGKNWSLAFASKAPVHENVIGNMLRRRASSCWIDKAGKARDELSARKRAVVDRLLHDLREKEANERVSLHMVYLSLRLEENSKKAGGKHKHSKRCVDQITLVVLRHVFGSNPDHIIASVVARAKDERRGRYQDPEYSRNEVEGSLSVEGKTLINPEAPGTCRGGKEAKISKPDKSKGAKQKKPEVIPEQVQANAHEAAGSSEAAPIPLPPGSPIPQPISIPQIFYDPSWGPGPACFPANNLHGGTAWTPPRPHIQAPHEAYPSQFAHEGFAKPTLPFLSPVRHPSVYVETAKGMATPMSRNSLSKMCVRKPCLQTQGPMVASRPAYHRAPRTHPLVQEIGPSKAEGHRYPPQRPFQVDHEMSRPSTPSMRDSSPSITSPSMNPHLRVATLLDTLKRLQSLDGQD